MKKALFLFGILFLTFLGFAQVTLPKLEKPPRFDLAPIANLSADYYNDTIILTWCFPETYQPDIETLSWSGEMSNQFGSFLRPNVYEDHAHRFDTLDLRNFIGWSQAPQQDIVGVQCGTSLIYLGKTDIYCCPVVLGPVLFGGIGLCLLGKERENKE